MTTSEQKSEQKISRDMTIESILTMFPHKAQRISHEITSAGLHCVGCHAATWETLEAGMLGHGMSEDSIDRLVGKLNAILQAESDPSTISLTPRAAKKFMEILAEEGKQGWGMRFEERMAGCSGFEYVLDYSEKANEDDQVFESHGIQIHVEKKTVPQKLGTEIDFVEGLNGAGFKISNPNQKSSCGCGNSHNY
ncbi:MAG: iron-sulfur cluster assembly accessory protein [Parachlamydiaceae bacterium]|nr:iron-sulfur cluster assembly accessory protein [Parachlamydiaceae bacterium]